MTRAFLQFSLFIINRTLLGLYSQALVIRFSLVAARARTKLRHDFPLLVPLVLLVLGQLIVLHAIWWILPALFIALRGSSRFSSFIVVLVGALLSTNLEPLMPVPTNSSSYLAIVDEAPRYRKPGEAQLSLSIIGKIRDRRALDKLEIFRFEKNIRTMCKAIDLPWRNANSLELGSKFIFRGRFSTTNGDSSYLKSLRRKGYTSTCKILYSTKSLESRNSIFSELRNRIEHRVRTVLGEGERAGFFLSMSLGTRDTVSERTERAFKHTGLAHLLVVSGYQVTLIFYLVQSIVGQGLKLLAKYFRINRAPTIAALFAFVFSWIFVMLVGSEGPSIRAGIALSIFVLCSMLERRASLFNASLVSLFLVVMIWPGSILEPGMQLTFAALFGIALGTALSPKPGVTQLTIVSFAASTFTSLVVFCWFGFVSIFGFFLNPIVAPLAALVSCKGGFLGYLLLCSGLDSNGHFLQMIAGLLWIFRSFVIELATIETLVSSSYCTLLIIVCIALSLVLRGLKFYFRSYGLEPSRH